MALANLSDLQVALGAWMHRNDLLIQSGDFIRLAESRMNSDLKSRSMEARATLTCTPGSTLTARLVALPSDLLEMRRLSVVDSDPAVTLEYKSPDQIIDDNPYLLTPARPDSFTVIGSNIELSPPPDQAYPLELIYQQRIPGITVSNTTNWLLTAYPDIYLWGMLVAACEYTQDDERIAVYEAKYRESVKTVNSIDWYSGSTLRVRAR